MLACSSKADVYGLTIDGGTIFVLLVGGGVYAFD